MQPVIDIGDEVTISGVVSVNGYDMGMPAIIPNTMSIISNDNDNAVLREKMIRSDVGYSELASIEGMPVKMQGRVYNLDNKLEKIMIKTPHLRSPGMTILTDQLSCVAEGWGCVFCEKSLRKHCTMLRCHYIRERLDQLVTYRQLVFQFLQVQRHGCLMTRVRTLPINKAGCVFLDEQHQRRVSEQLTSAMQRGILVRSSCW